MPEGIDGIAGVFSIAVFDCRRVCRVHYNYIILLPKVHSLLIWITSDSCKSELRQYPDAPCLEYLPTFGLVFEVNVGVYSIYGASGVCIMYWSENQILVLHIHPHLVHINIIPIQWLGGNQGAKPFIFPISSLFIGEPFGAT